MRTYLIAFFLLMSLSLRAQSIENISVKGNYYFTEDEYFEWSLVKKGSIGNTTLTDSVKKRVSVQLARRGFISADPGKTYIEYSPDSSKCSVIINIDEGEPSEIANIYITGLKDSLVFLQSINELKGAVFRSAGIEQFSAELLDYYENNGFPFASVKINSLIFYKDSSDIKNIKNLADVSIRIDAGRYSRIDKIEVKGSSKTKDYVVIREARLASGIPYSQKLIDDLPAKINRLKFFEPVGIPEYYQNSKNEGTLSVNIKDRQTNSFDGVVGFVPGNNDKSGYITGLVNISLSNMLGTGRNASVKWQKIDRYSQELNFKYLEPWLFGYPFNVSLALYQLKQDTSYVDRKYSSSVEFLATSEISASVSMEFESVIPTLSEYAIKPAVYNSSLITTGLNLKIDTRDDIYAPRRGIYFTNSYYYTKKKINGPEEYIGDVEQLESSIQRLELDFGVFVEVFNRQVIAAEIHGRELRGSFIEVSDLYHLGGMRSLRGYMENQFLANRVLWSNIEYRLLFTNRSYVFTFFDIGYYLRNSDAANDILKTTGVKPGYGFGVNLETGLGVLSVSYALAKGDGLNNGKIHFGFIGNF